jgi:transcriptional regulator with XRE-family HTH domain
MTDLPDPLMVTCRARRIALGIPIHQAARDMGKSKSALSGWERGIRIPPLPEARRYANYLKLTVIAFAVEIAARDDDDPGCEIITGPDIGLKTGPDSV